MGILANLAKNPSFLLIAGVGVALFVFRDKISDFLSTITGGAEAAATAGEITNLGLTNLQGNLTGISDTLNNLTASFQNFQFPDFSNLFENILNNQQSILAGQTVDGITIPPDTIVNPDGTVEGSPPTFTLDDMERAAAAAALEANRERARLEAELDRIAASGEDISGAEFASARNANEFRARQQAALDAALRSNVDRNPNVQTDVEGNVFRGGGQSFIGGTVREIPIDRLSLGGIIDRFNVTASQAADIRARAQDDFGGFNFGTNTGSGIGGVFSDPLINTQLSNQGQVSDQQFAGLSATRIAQLLTGGSITNF